METKHTTAVGFLDPKLVAATAQDHSNEKDESISEEEVEENTLQTMYGGIMVGVGLFILLLLGVGLFIRWNNKKQE